MKITAVLTLLIAAQLGSASPSIAEIKACIDLAPQEAAPCLFALADSQCINVNTITTAAQCLQTAISSVTTPQIITEAVRNCTSELASCVNATIQEAIANIPLCVNETVRALARCGIDNAEACKESCAGSERNDFSGLN
jgi:hypothetical protein